MKLAIKARSGDNVAQMLQDAARGDVVLCGGTRLAARVALHAGDKIATRTIQKSETVIRYGLGIGRATHKIEQGCSVETTHLGPCPLAAHPPEQAAAEEGKSVFCGYRRPWGAVGIRNEIWIISLAGCTNSVAQRLEREAKELNVPELDGIYAFCQPYGCSQGQEDLERTERFLAGMIRHGNAAAVLVVGLSCASNSPERLQEKLRRGEQNRVRFLDCQKCTDEIQCGMEMLKELCDGVRQTHREPIPAKELVVGVKCGASDEWSPLTGNPVIGAFADRLIAQGGSVILTELSELAGAYRHLKSRCDCAQTQSKLLQMAEIEKRRYMRYGEAFYSGLASAEETVQGMVREVRQLAFIQKGGTSPVRDVLFYGQLLKTRGLNILQAPGYDMVAASALAQSGAHLILFSTGKGSPFGSFVPTFKISNTTQLYKTKRHWLDFDAGRRLAGSTAEQLAGELLQRVLEVASGQKTRNEENGYRDLSIWKDGITC